MPSGRNCRNDWGWQHTNYWCTCNNSRWSQTVQLNESASFRENCWVVPHDYTIFHLTQLVFYLCTCMYMHATIHASVSFYRLLYFFKLISQWSPGPAGNSSLSCCALWKVCTATVAMGTWHTGPPEWPWTVSHRTWGCRAEEEWDWSKGIVRLPYTFIILCMYMCMLDCQ